MQGPGGGDRIGSRGRRPEDFRQPETYTSVPADYDPGVSDPNLTVAARIPDALQAAVAEQLARASEEDVAGRLAREDATLWGRGRDPNPFPRWPTASAG